MSKIVLKVIPLILTVLMTFFSNYVESQKLNNCVLNYPSSSKQDSKTQIDFKIDKISKEKPRNIDNIRITKYQRILFLKSLDEFIEKNYMQEILTINSLKTNFKIESINHIQKKS